MQKDLRSFGSDSCPRKDPDEEERSDSFGPIDIGMWSSPGWEYVREVAEEAEKRKPSEPEED